MQFQKYEIKSHMDTLLENLKEDVFNYIGELSTLIEEKELDIIRLQEEVKILTDELEQIKKNNQESKTEIDHASPLEQIVKKSPNDINKYLKTVKWSEIPASDILSVAKYSIVHKHYEAADMALKALCDYYIKGSKITNTDWEEFVRVLSQYVKCQVNQRSFHVDGISYILTTVVQMGWSELLDSFLDKNFSNMEKIILKSSLDKSAQALGLTVLSMYFLLSYDGHAQKWLDKLLNGNILSPDRIMDERQHLNLLFISMCYQKDDVILERFLPIEKLQPEIPEVECYNIFYDTINKLISYEDGKNEIKRLGPKIKVLNDQIKIKAMDYIMSVLEQCQREDELKVVV